MVANGYKGIKLNSICNIKSGCNEWRNAMFTANGETGIIGGLNPSDDVFIFNNTKFVMDTVDPMETAELYPIDFQMKQAAITRGNAGIWVDYLKDGGLRSLFGAPVFSRFVATYKKFGYN